MGHNYVILYGIHILFLVFSLRFQYCLQDEGVHLVHRTLNIFLLAVALFFLLSDDIQNSGVRCELSEDLKLPFGVEAILNDSSTKSVLGE